MTRPLDLAVTVDSVPDPGLLRPAIEAALAGRSWPAGPEARIARAVAEAVAAAVDSSPSGGGDPSC